MLDLAERVASGREIADIPNGAYTSHGRVVLNDLRPPIADLDELSFPDFAFQEEYLLDREGNLVPNIGMRDTEKILFSGSRGCNNNCAYCSNAQLKAIYGGNVRYARKMSVPAFLNAVRECRRHFPKVKQFYFTDEDFLARSVDGMREFAETYPSAVGVPFEIMASPRNATQEKVALAAKAGLRKIDVGIESGSERTRREVFNRYIDDETQMRAALTISKHKEVIAFYFLILGNPYEKRQDLLDGIRILQKIPSPFYLQTYNLVFIPGTKLFDKACEDGIINGICDSAYEMDFLAGFDHKGYEWKRKNLYLNSFMQLMSGKSTRMRMGYVPRMFIPALTNKQMVDFCDKYPRIGESIMWQANFVQHFVCRLRRDAKDLAAVALLYRRIVQGFKRFLPV